MKKAEIATSTIISISIALVVLVIIIGGVIFKINGGLSDLDKEKCHISNDADNDGIVDKLDPCPCDNPKKPEVDDFKNNCRGCPNYKNPC